jgi:alkylation response protein AidB-like acyl-CoA dehydrogenase
MAVTDAAAQKPFARFLEDFTTRLQHLFHVRADIDRLSIKRGLPPFMMREIMAENPLATYIPTRYGGRGGKIDEGLALLAAASYESLPLALGFGINWALFLQPVSKYARDEAKPDIFTGFIRDRKMGGLMITEPDYGSDALHMQSCYSETDDLCHIQGTKHWAGLTGWADYWLLTARRKTPSGDLHRDIDFFVCDVSAPQQHVVVEEFYENLGIYMLPYGRNRINVRVPGRQKLQPQSTGIKMMLDLLHRSRMQFPGMAMGFLQRLLDEAVEHCRQRQVGGRSLFSYDQVQQRIAQLQTAYTVCSAMCLNSSGKAGLDTNLATRGLEANTTKTHVTDLMQEAAQSLLQLVGAKGYRLDHIAGRALVDSRPFQIFEGSNDILYIQIAEAVQKQMQRAKKFNLLGFCRTHELTDRAAEALRKTLDFELQGQMAQRKLTEFGRLFSRVVSLNLVHKLADSGFRSDLIRNAAVNLEQEISALTSGYRQANSSEHIADYQAGGSWFECQQKL